MRKKNSGWTAAIAAAVIGAMSIVVTLMRKKAGD